MLGDGYSSFRWTKSMMITADSPAIEGSESYGLDVYPAVFDPPCDAYKAVKDGIAIYSATSTNHSQPGYLARYAVMEGEHAISPVVPPKHHQSA